MFLEGKATFTEKLNGLSDMPRDLFKKEKTGQINIPLRGYFNLDPSKWYTHPELEKIYESRQTYPASYDARTKGNLLFLGPINFLVVKKNTFMFVTAFFIKKIWARLCQTGFGHV